MLVLLSKQNKEDFIVLLKQPRSESSASGLEDKLLSPQKVLFLYLEPQKFVLPPRDPSFL